MSSQHGLDGAAPAPRYWFPAKQHGWGWGLPVMWQGWAVIAVLLVILVAGEWRLPPLPPHPPLAVHLVYLAIVTWVFIGICYLKGEPPRWRWGSDR
jgi:uncharacterized membrane protein YhaH (DUF805 family)